MKVSGVVWCMVCVCVCVVGVKSRGGDKPELGTWPWMESGVGGWLEGGVLHLVLLLVSGARGVVSVLVLVLVDFLRPLVRVVSAGCKWTLCCVRACVYKCVYVCSKKPPR